MDKIVVCCDRNRLTTKYYNNYTDSSYSNIFFGDEAKTGRANYDDIREGKYTLLVHDAFETATPDDIAQLTAIIGSEDADSADVATVRGIFRRSGAERRSREAIRASVQDALDAAARYEKIWNQDVRRVLEELIGTLRIETDTYE